MGTGGCSLAGLRIRSSGTGDQFLIELQERFHQFDWPIASMPDFSRRGPGSASRNKEFVANEVDSVHPFDGLLSHLFIVVTGNRSPKSDGSIIYVKIHAAAGHGQCVLQLAGGLLSNPFIPRT